MMRLEVTSPSTREVALASSVPIGQIGFVYIWGRNDMSTSQHIGIHWVIRDPAGEVVEDYEDWAGWPWLTRLNPGDSHMFVGGRLNLNREGIYRIKVDLLMNTPDNPVVVDSYDGDLCSTTEVPPECRTDADCPEGYVCVNGVCVPEEEVEKKIPWGPVAIGAGALIALLGLSAAAKKG